MKIWYEAIKIQDQSILLTTPRYLNSVKQWSNDKTENLNEMLYLYLSRLSKIPDGKFLGVIDGYSDKRSEINSFLLGTKSDGVVTKLKASKYWHMMISYTEHLPDLSDKERIYLYLHQMKSQPKCGKGNNLTFRTIPTGYSEFCHDRNNCLSCGEISRNRAIKTMEEDGGIGLANPKTMKKSRDTLGLKYGLDVQNPGQIKSHKDDMQVNNPMFDESVKQTQIERSLEKNGVSYSSQSHLGPAIMAKLEDKEWLFEQFRLKSIQDIASELDIRQDLVNRYLLKHEIRQKREWTPELQIRLFLEGLGISNFIQNSKSILKSGLQLDFYLPNHKIAIEHCGFYHHTAQFGRDKWYHYQKMKECQDIGIRLVTIFEDEWLFQQGIMKNYLRNILSPDKKRIYGRDTEVRMITIKEANQFYEQHHMMGGIVKYSSNIGLFLGDQLVGCATFQDMKNSIPKRYNQYSNVYYLSRYCVSDMVIGGLNKIIAFLRSKLTYGFLLYTFADARFSSGELYRNSGFQEDGFDNPNYWYTKNQRKFHKFGFRLKKLKMLVGDLNGRTEEQIMKELRYERIWDCGKYRFKKFID